MKYIILLEDGESLTSESLPPDATKLKDAGITAVIRVLDCKELLPSGSWVDMNRWEDEQEKS